MKKLNKYIIEKLKINNNTELYNYFPKTRNELKQIINQLIEERGNEANLNDIDVSNIKDMTWLFRKSEFNGDISKWNVSNVKDMTDMFWDSKFNGDISKWDVSKVENMFGMFFSSNFNGDISKWDVSNVTNMKYIFSNCPLQNNPPAWYEETK